MGAPFLSRHFLAEQAQVAALLPFPPSGADGGTAHALLALGGWAQDAQEHHLTIADLAVCYRGTNVAAQPTLSRLASFEPPAPITSLAGGDLGAGRVLLLAGAADGSLSRLRLQVPTAPGSHPEQIQVGSRACAACPLVWQAGCGWVGGWVHGVSWGRVPSAPCPGPNRFRRGLGLCPGSGGDVAGRGSSCCVSC